MSHRYHRRRSYDSSSSYDGSSSYDSSEEDMTYDSDRVKVDWIMEEMASLNDQIDALSYRLCELCEELHILSLRRSDRPRDDDDDGDGEDIVEDEVIPGLRRPHHQHHQQRQHQSASSDDGSRCELVVGTKEAQYLSLMKTDLNGRLIMWSDAYCWVRHCIGLRNNDPCITSTGHGVVAFSLQSQRLPNHFGQILSECLRYNTHVTDITLCMSDLPLVDRQSNNNSGDVGMIPEDTRALLDYVQTSTILQRVTLTGDPSTHTRDMATLFFDAISKNPTIQDLHCDYLYNFPIESFSALVSSTTSIKALSLRCYGWLDYTPAEQSLLVQAMAHNQSVERLRLYCFETDEAMMGSVLQSFVQSIMPLRTLALRATPNVQFRSLASFLQYNATPLHHLELKDLRLNDVKVECILRGLRQQQFNIKNVSSRSSSITKLSIRNCEFEDEAPSTFMSFMRSPIINGNDHPESNGDHAFIPLQELHMQFDDDEEDEHADGTFGSLPLGHAMALMVVPTAHTNMDLISSNTIHDRRATSVLYTPSLQPQQKSIGSQLRTLFLHPFDRLRTTGFCDTVRANAHIIQLSCLRLSRVQQRDCQQLLTCLPYLLSLQELYLYMAEHEKPAEECLLLLQQSGSIRKMSVLSCDGLPLWGPDDFRIKRAFCQRNQHLRDTLLQCQQIVIRHDCTNENENMMALLSEEGLIFCDSDDVNSNHSDTEDIACLFPTLLQVAKQIPYTRVSTLLSSLLLVKVVDWMDTHDKPQQPPLSTTTGSTPSLPPNSVAPWNVIDTNPPNVDQQRKSKKQRQLTLSEMLRPVGP